MKDFSIYIHIPFCISKCKYCDFNSYSNIDEYIDKYIECLKKEIEIVNINKDEYICRSIYIGGGTPSYIDSKYIVEILKIVYEKYNIDKNAEITIEVNPCSVTKEKLLDYYNAGINRISMGLQTCNDELLKIIGRKHTYKEFLDKYTLIKKVGFNNINIDLMLGLPNQSLEDLIESVNNVIKLNPNHISCYSLILYENTKLYKDIIENKYILPDDKLERDMYYKMVEILKQNGYIQYEISNFCKDNQYSRHNMMCWKQNEYIGFGAGAHSFIDSSRFSNIDSVKKYIDNIENDNLKDNIVIQEIMNKNDLMKEYMLLGFRLINGINIEEFKNKFDEEVKDIFRDELNKLINQEYIKLEGKNYVLTNKGIDFNNIICEEFI